MRIAIAGSAGTGKTTLAAALSERLGARLVGEQYEDFFETSGRFKRPPERLRDLIRATLERKYLLEMEAPRSVSDRCPVDLFNLWLSRGFARRQRETAEFQRGCVARLSHYDHVVVMPWGRLPLVQNEAEGSRRRRVMNPWVQFHNHSTIIGLVRQWVHPDRILPVPPRLVDLDARVTFIAARAQSSGTDRAGRDRST